MSPSAPVCSPTFTISSGSASSIPVDSSAEVRLAPSRIRGAGAAPPPAPSRGCRSTRPPPRARSAAAARRRAASTSVRISWLVAYIRIRPPKYGRRSSAASSATPEPSRRSQSTTDEAGYPQPEHDAAAGCARSVVATASRIRVGSGSSTPGPRRSSRSCGITNTSSTTTSAAIMAQQHDRVDRGRDRLLAQRLVEPQVLRRSAAAPSSRLPERSPATRLAAKIGG